MLKRNADNCITIVCSMQCNCVFFHRAYLRFGCMHKRIYGLILIKSNILEMKISSFWCFDVRSLWSNPVGLLTQNIVLAAEWLPIFMSWWLQCCDAICLRVLRTDHYDNQYITTCILSYQSTIVCFGIICSNIYHQSILIETVSSTTWPVS